LTEYASLSEKPVEDHTRFFETLPPGNKLHRPTGAYQSYVEAGLKSSLPGSTNRVL
jgi:hypothetical protein